MGVSITKIIQEPSMARVINDIMESVSVKSVETCKNTVNNSQSISFGSINLKNCDLSITNLNQEINSRVNTTCYQTNNFKDILTTVLDSKMDEMIKINSPSGINLINTIKSNLDISKLTECMSNSSNIQRVALGDITMDCRDGQKVVIDNISQKITSDVIFNCIQSSNPELIVKINELPPPEKDDPIIPIDYTPIIIGSVIGGIILILLIVLIVVLSVKAYPR